MNLTIPQSFGLQFVDWGALVAEQMAEYGVAAPLNETDWKVWVCALFYVPEIASLNVPTPEPFATWQEWADMFVDSVR